MMTAEHWAETVRIDAAHSRHELIATIKSIQRDAKPDIEAMLKACIPGGSVCDPQVVADNIRTYFA